MIQIFFQAFFMRFCFVRHLSCQDNPYNYSELHLSKNKSLFDLDSISPVFLQKIRNNWKLVIYSGAKFGRFFHIYCLYSVDGSRNMNNLFSFQVLPCCFGITTLNFQLKFFLAIYLKRVNLWKEYVYNILSNFQYALKNKLQSILVNE